MIAVYVGPVGPSTHAPDNRDAIKVVASQLELAHARAKVTV